MSAIEVVLFGVLWVVLMALAALVLLLYRQLDKAYDQASLLSGRALPRGAVAPDVEVLADGRIANLDLPADSEVAVVGFLTSGCDSCARLMEALGDRSLERFRRIALFSGDDAGRPSAPDGVETWSLAHPPDVMREYGVVEVPMVYVLAGRTVLAAGTAASEADLRRLLADADAAPATNGDGAYAPAATSETQG